jgi:hypothetical protein
MGLLDQIRHHREGNPFRPKAGSLIPTKRVLRSCENPRSDGEVLVGEWVSTALYFDPGACEFVGNSRKDWQTVEYGRGTLRQSYEAFCAERQAVPCSIKSFVRRILETTESLGWPPVFRDRAFSSRRLVVRGVRLRNETRWTGEDVDQVPRNRNQRKSA